MEKICNLANIKKLYWKDIRTRVHKVNPDLAKLIDDVDPGKDFPLYLASYPYGKVIVDKGKYFLPSADRTGELFACDDSRIPSSIREDFAYSKGRLPVGMVINKTLEVLSESRNNLIPWGLHLPGNIFALWRELERGPVYNHPASTVVSGIRSAYMIPPIRENEPNLKLKRYYGFSATPPVSLSCQWEIFKGICQSPRIESNWYSQLLFFTNKWFEKIRSNDPAWVFIHRYLLQYAWDKTGYWRNEIFYDHAFSRALDGRENLRPDGYTVDSARHLYKILAGASPGFAVAVDDEGFPTSIIQEAYLDIYGLKKYVPTIMHSSFFSPNDLLKKIYYSIIFPTTLEFATKRSNIKNSFHFIHELKLVTRVLKTEITRGNIGIEKTILGQNSINCEFDYFHMCKDPYMDVRLTSLMAQEDEMLTKCLVKCNNKEFDHLGNFVRACVRISCKKNDL